MKKLSEIERSDYNTYFTTKDHSITFPLNVAVINYQTRVNLKDGTFYEKPCIGNVNIPTLQQLVDRGMLIEHNYVTDVRVTSEDCDFLNGCWNYRNRPRTIDFKAVQSKFKEKGINVSLEAIKYAWRSWKQGLRSGYRGKGFHLYAPCGKDVKLYFSASKLDKHFETWQKTYTTIF